MFDAKRFLKEKFRSVSELEAFLKSYNVDSPKADTIGKWFQRGSVPSEWLPVLICYLEIDSGQPVPLSPYLVAR